jgi:hypothetical protein
VYGGKLDLPAHDVDGHWPDNIEPTT